MKRTAAISALALLVLTGCSAADAGSKPDATASASKASRPSATATPTPAIQLSKKEACVELFGNVQDGPLFETVMFLSEFYNDPETAAADPAFPTTVHRLNIEVQDILEDAPTELRSTLTDFALPLNEMSNMLNGTGEALSDLDDYKVAGKDLVLECSPYDPSPGTAAGTGKTAAVSKADEISAAYPGYPLIVNVASLDYRVANWFEGKLVDGQVVALAPGLYSPYNPNVPDLGSYYESGGVYGDSAMKDAVLPHTGGSTWSGVLPGAEEPQ